MINNLQVYTFVDIHKYDPDSIKLRTVLVSLLVYQGRYWSKSTQVAHEMTKRSLHVLM